MNNTLLFAIALGLFPPGLPTLVLRTCPQPWYIVFPASWAASSLLFYYLLGGSV